MFEESVYVYVTDIYHNYAQITVSSSMKSIAFVDVFGLPYDGDTLNRRGLGGSESALIQISRELAKLGFDVKVFNDCTS